jgi:hypothetical protein
MANYDAPALFYDSGVLYDETAPPQIQKGRMAKVKLNLASLDDQQLLLLANAIVTAMTGNASFTTPVPPLATLTTQITAGQTAVDASNAANQTAKQRTTEKNTALDAIRATLTGLAGYVQAASGGDEAKIQSAGMSVRAGKTPAGLPGTVMNLALSTGDNAGEVDAQWDFVAGAKTYEVQVSPDPVTPTSWTSQPLVTKSKAVILNLTSGARVWIRVRATNSAGTGAWSDPATKIVP